MNVAEIVTSKIIEQLQQGTIPWQKPWHGSPAINYITRKPYQGINVLLLGRGGEFATWNQIKELNGLIKKGSESSMVVYYNTRKVMTDNEEEKSIPFMRYYRVFHLSDIEGIESKIPVNTFDPLEQAEQIIPNYSTCPEIIEDNNRAWYSPSKDQIGIPKMGQFKTVEEYYSTLWHEAIHSTGHTSRLNRFSAGQEQAAFGSENYSKEELIAEIGSAMLCCYCGIEKTIENSASYIASWLKVLKNDNNFVIQASSKAQKAYDYILNNN